MSNNFMDYYKNELIKEVTESDWIVLRLCMEIVYSGHFNGENFPEGDRAINFMRRKYGSWIFDEEETSLSWRLSERTFLWFVSFAREAVQ